MNIQTEREAMEKEFFGYISSMNKQEIHDFLSIVKAGMKDETCCDAVLEWAKKQRSMGRKDNLLSDAAEFVRQYAGVMV